LFSRSTGNYREIGDNAISVTNSTIRNHWSNLYAVIYYCNSAMEGLSKSSAVTESIKRRLVAEARFVRALSYFYLVNAWGDVPLATGTDYRVNRSLHRSSIEDVYDLILSDLVS